MLTGTIPSRHGIHDWIRRGNYDVEKDGPDARLESLRGQSGYIEMLPAEGYDCAISGKWHLGDAHRIQKGFSFWEVHAEGGGPYFNALVISRGEIGYDPGYIMDAITDHALDFLRTRPGKQTPFYLGVHSTALHSPWDRQNHPSAVYDRYYNNCAFASLPLGLVPLCWVKGVSIPVNTMEKRRANLSEYNVAVEEMDHNVGRIIDWLEAHGMREKTLLVFLSDNGMNMGHHGVYGKGNATLPLNIFEESVRIPFIVSCPGTIQD